VVGGKKRNGTYLVVLAAVVRSCDVGSVHFLKVVARLAGSDGRVGEVNG
jgi:hypothetical protein